MEISIHSPLDSSMVVATKFCTATELQQGVVSIEFELRERPLVKRAPGRAECISPQPTSVCSWGCKFADGVSVAEILQLNLW